MRPKTPRNLPQIQDKRAAVVRLRAEGLTWDQVAERTGFASGSGAYKAWKAAIKQAPDESVAEVRAAERQRLAEMDARLAEIIAAGSPVKTTSIGRTQWDPRSCTCGVRGDTKRDHAEDCEVLPVLDSGPIVRAISERRALGESLRKLVSADAAPSAPVFDERYLRMLAEVQVARTQMAEQAPAVRLEPLPDGYATMTPEQQAEADMTRRRRQVDAQRVVIKGEIEA